MATDASVRSVDELRQFGDNLTRAGENLVVLFQRLNSQMHRACEGWNDDQNRKFMAEFEQQTKEISKMSQEMGKYAQFIKRTCDLLDQYKSLR
ncbi:MAG: hypothetical protein K2I61_03010 [Muribaculaceae bacterium]|nr:hypothetical protein [Muribaculaceae bacterium]